MGKKYIIISSLLACVFLYFLEQVIVVDYLVKTISKVLLFSLIPFIYIRFRKKTSLKDAIRNNKLGKQNLKIGILYGIISFAIIMITYFLVKDAMDIPGIAAELQNKSKIRATNFIFVGLYIIVINSFLEEVFFRGFIFLGLYEMNHKKSAYIYSSVLFGLYHIAIFKNWFNIWLIGLALSGLIGVGFIFNWLDTKSGNFINSWIVHALADVAIILIGLHVFGIL